ncbi:MAG: LmbE family N-acetylglucosaminyl deacetylase, partial [Pseudohongiellaceae bacterium]
MATRPRRSTPGLGQILPSAALVLIHMLGHALLLAPLVVPLFVLGACTTTTLVPVDTAYVTEGPRDPNAPRVLAVVAHPDDDVAFAGLMYKNATHLGGLADVCVLTNGEGGFKYATLAESIYGLQLTDEDIGRRELPAIRRGEMVNGARVMNVRRVMFLGQRDHRYTTDEFEILGEGAEIWDVDGVRQTLAGIMRDGGYDFVVTFFPSEGTHGHHKSAALLALQAVESLPANERPITLGARFVRDGDPRSEPQSLPGWPITEAFAGAPTFDFQRSQGFGHQDKLNYNIIANWAIAAHRSQGTMQLFMGRGSDIENYVLFAHNPASAEAEASAWFERLAEPQFEARS